MYTWLDVALRGVFQRYFNDDGQAEALVIALVVLILILILSGRRVTVQ